MEGTTVGEEEGSTGNIGSTSGKEGKGKEPSTTDLERWDCP